jgi:hypothetical protein
MRYGSAASTVVVGKTHTATGTETLESGMAASGALDRIDFLSIDSGESIGGLGVSRVDYTNYPIRAGQNSYERWVRGKWDFVAGTNKISGVKFWISNGANVTGATIRIHGIQTGTYTAPASGNTIVPNTNNTLIATGGATVAPTGANPWENALSVFFSGNTNAVDLTASNYSNYIVLQLKTESTAAPGNVEVKTFTIQYDES